MSLGDGTVITSAEIQNAEPYGPNKTHIVITSAIAFHSLPGKGIVTVSIRPDSLAGWLVFEHTFEVIGLVLYNSFDSSGRRRYISGRSAVPLQLKRAEGGALIATVDAVVYAGTKSVEERDLRKGEITMSVTPNGTLPWSATECRIATELDSLDDRCSMAFSLDFSKFSVRVPDRNNFKMIGAVVEFHWPGLRKYFQAVQTVNGNFSQTIQLKSDRVTDTMVRWMASEERGGAEQGIAAWKLVVIGVACGLAVNAGIFLVIFGMLRHGKAETHEGMTNGGFGELEPERVKGRPWGYLIKKQSEVREMPRFGVEPAAAGTGSALPISEGGGGIGGSGVSRGTGGILVLNGVKRGVDLEPGTMAGSLALREIEVSDPAMAENLYVSGGEVKHVVKGVNAAIKRGRQLDLLPDPPSSRGLVRRRENPFPGEIPAVDGDGCAGLVLTISPFPVSR